MAPVWTEIIETMDQLPVSTGFQEFSDMWELHCPDLRRAQTCIKGEVWGFTADVNIDCYECSLHGAKLYMSYVEGNEFEKQLMDFQEHIKNSHKELLK